MIDKIKEKFKDILAESDIELLLNRLDDEKLALHEQIQAEEVKTEKESVRQLPTHEELRAQGIDLPNEIPVEEIIWDREAEAEHKVMIMLLAERFLEWKKEKLAREAIINSKK